MNKKHWLIILFLVAAIVACKKEVIDSFAGFQKPANFPSPEYHFSTNEITKEGFELGRKLFYDPMLSANNTISCGSCHIQTAAFTHNGHSVSHGIHGLLGTRNTPAIMNLAWSSSYMWDGGIVDLDLQSIAPVTNHVEMDETVENVLNKLRINSQYPALFKNAFGSEEINSQRFLKALSQFMLMCVSSNSKYDSVMCQQSNAQFTQVEALGYALFKQKCNSCHTEPLFTDNSFRNNGLPPSNINDEGRYLITLNTLDRYRFRVPTLRNLDFTSPYMHDGRFFTLNEVMDHYSDHVQQTPNLDIIFQQGSSIGIGMNGNEKMAILSFLKTLDDRSFLIDKRLSEQ